MKQRVLVAIIYLECDLDKLVYSLNMVLAQKYPYLELLITGSVGNSLSIRSLLETLESNRKENLKKVLFDFSKDFYDKETYIKNVLDYAVQENLENICILIDGDAFYDGDSLTNFMRNKTEDIFNIGKVSNSGFFEVKRECYEKDKQVYVPKKDVLIVTTEKKNIDRNRNRKSYTSKEPDYHVMNYTNSLFYLNCVTELKNRTISSDKILRIKETIRFLQKSNSSVWGMTNDDRILINKLDNLLCINDSVFRRVKVRTLKYQMKQEIKMVFFCQDFSSWTSLQSVYEQACRDSRYEAKLVYVPFFHFNGDKEKALTGIQEYIDAGYSIINYDQYDLASDHPDIAIFVSPYSYVPDGFDIEEVCKVVRRCIYIPYGLTMESYAPELVRLRYRLAMHILAWKVLCDDEFDAELERKLSYTNGHNCLPIGNPRMDMIKRIPLDEDKDYINEIYKQASGRKIVLWNTHHSVSSQDCFSSWSKFGKAVLSYFKNHTDVFLLWRPHPLFKGAMDQYLGRVKAIEFWRKLKSMNNLYIDEYKSYTAAIAVADLFISDQSSLVKEFVFLNKPIIVTVMDEKDIINEDLKKCLYLPADVQELFLDIDFLIGGGQDLKKHYREEYINRINICERNSVAENLLDYVYANINKELKDLSLY